MQTSEKNVFASRIFAGEVRAQNQIILSSKLAGMVKQIFVNEGQIVEYGAPLLTIDDQPVQEKVQALKASLQAVKKEGEAAVARLAYAQSNYQRFKELFDESAATKEELERWEAEFNALSAQVESLQSREKEISANIAETKNIFSYTRLRAPSKVVVAQRLVDQGTYVDPGQPLIILDDLTSGFWLEAGVDESLLGSLKPGDQVQVDIPGLHESQLRPISEVVGAVDPATRTFMVKVVLEGSDFRSGLYGRLVLLRSAQKRLLIPWRVIVLRGEITGVYVVDKEKAVHFRVVRLGGSFEEGSGGFRPVLAPSERAEAREVKDLMVEVLSGLSGGELLVVSPLEKVGEGDIITEVKQK